MNKCIECSVFINIMDKNEAGNWMPGEKASLTKKHLNRYLKGLGLLAYDSLREEGSGKRVWSEKELMLVLCVMFEEGMETSVAGMRLRQEGSKPGEVT